MDIGDRFLIGAPVVAALFVLAFGIASCEGYAQTAGFTTKDPCAAGSTPPPQGCPRPDGR